MMPSPAPRSEFLRLRERLSGLLPGGSFDVYFPPNADSTERSKFRQNLATRVNTIRRALPAGWEFSVRTRDAAALTVTRLGPREALQRKRTAALAAGRDHPFAPPGVPDPYPLRVQRNADHLGTEYFDHLSPPAPGPAAATRVHHRRALKEALTQLKPGGTLHWPLPPGHGVGPALAQERTWLLARIEDFRRGFDPLLGVVVGLNEARTGLIVRRPDPRSKEEAA